MGEKGRMNWLVVLVFAVSSAQFQAPPSFRSYFPQQQPGAFPAHSFEAPDYNVMKSSSLPALPSEMKREPPRAAASSIVVPPPLLSNDDVNADLRDPRNFGPPPSLDDIRQRRQELDRQRAEATPPGGNAKTSSRLAQWLPQQNAPHEKAQQRLKKVREEMQELFGAGPAYAQHITRLGDLAIEAELVPHMSASRELKFMDGTGNGATFFDVNPNHPIDSSAIQQGVNAIEQSRTQHKQWTQEEKQAASATHTGAPPLTTPTATDANAHAFAIPDRQLPPTTTTGNDGVPPGVQSASQTFPQLQQLQTSTAPIPNLRSIAMMRGGPGLGGGSGGVGGVPNAGNSPSEAAVYGGGVIGRSRPS